ncbi:hypothetical protein SAMN05216516_1022 [Izhakiella capsodis]|uniref:Uncharacterized protein n=1 Tax=Izhakiella capsodis TaxID=1367852 RepID=A0A1I4VQA1_9GAMM|nr:hypothetical protein SAMN05216516_1022 [Izhakiella capsodis]
MPPAKKLNFIYGLFEVNFHMIPFISIKTKFAESIV